MTHAKTLKVAIVAIGTALLLGSGLAAAQNVLLDPNHPQYRPLTTIHLAFETIDSTDVTMRGDEVFYNVDLGFVTFFGALAFTNIPEGYFVAFKMNGAIFRADPGVNTGSTTQPIVQGGAGYDQVVIAVPTGGFTRRDNPNFSDAIASHVNVSIADAVALASAEEGAVVTASWRAYRTQFEAIEGNNPIGIEHFGGVGEIIENVPGVIAEVTPGATSTADAETGFRWFVNPAGNPANTASAVLGTFMVHEVRSNRGLGAMPPVALDARNNDPVQQGVLLTNANGALFRLEGELGIGAFNLTRILDGALMDPTATPMAVCPNPTAGTAENPLTGDFVAAEDMPNVAQVSRGAGTYALCVTVDTMGPMSNAQAVPATEFMGTVILPGNANLSSPHDQPRELASGVVGRIDRNGSTVNIDFLTTAERYNQRLIIVNRGFRAVEITGVEFKSEDGVEASLASGIDLMIDSGERKVYMVGDMLEIVGRNRTAAMLSLNGAPSSLSVATTTENRDDGSTDTVVWPVN